MGTSRHGDLALVLSGGGARAAYQVGFLRFLARQFPDVVPGILTGVSAGGNQRGLPRGAPGALYREGRASGQPLGRSAASATCFASTRAISGRVSIRWGGRLVAGGRSPLRPAGSFVDTAPLRQLLERELQATGGELTGIARNVQDGWLRAIALAASSYTTGQSVTWVQTADCRMPMWERPQRKSATCALRVDHVMATAALPFFFPAVPVDGAWYGDGGIRLAAPLSPAVHLGARRIVAISTRYGRSREEAEVPAMSGYPPPAQVAGVLLNAIFLDLLDGDALHLQQINQLVARLPEGERDGLRHIDLLVLRPSQDLGQLANQFEPELPSTFRFLTRGLGTRETRSNDLLSLVMFQSNYLRQLIEMGEADAAARADDIRRFLDR